MTWRPTPNGQPACSMRRRRSWRPNGYACSRTRPCGSVNSPTCPPTFLRPGPARPASASPPPRGGGQANRGQRSVAGGRRGDGPRRRYGRPSGPLRRAGSPAERHCRTREVMPPPMITSRQRRHVPATITPMSRHRFRLQRLVGLRHAPPLVVACRSGPVHRVVAQPGQAAGRPRGPSCGHPGPSPTTR